jgi:hypothetical protein
VDQQAEIARLTHERLHWQDEATRLNRIVHAQRARIQQLEGSPQTLLWRRVVTFLQVIEPVLLRATHREDRMDLEKKIREVIDV